MCGCVGTSRPLGSDSRGLGGIGALQKQWDVPTYTDPATREGELLQELDELEYEVGEDGA